MIRIRDTAQFRGGLLIFGLADLPILLVWSLLWLLVLPFQRSVVMARLARAEIFSSDEVIRIRIRDTAQFRGG